MRRGFVEVCPLITESGLGTLQVAAYCGHGVGQSDAFDLDAGRESGGQACRQGGIKHDKDAVVVAAADQAAKGLAQAQAGEHVVPAVALEGLAARLVQDVGARPGHTVEDDEAQGTAGDVDAVAHRVGAQQACILLGAEDVDQGAGVHGVDMLGVERQPGVFQGLGGAAMDVAQAGDGGEEAECAASRSQEQLAKGGGDLAPSFFLTSLTTRTRVSLG